MGNLRALGYRPVFSRGQRACVLSAQKSKLNTSCSTLLETLGYDYVGQKSKKSWLWNSEVPRVPSLKDQCSFRQKWPYI